MDRTRRRLLHRWCEPTADQGSAVKTPAFRDAFPASLRPPHPPLRPPSHPMRRVSPIVLRNLTCRRTHRIFIPVPLRRHFPPPRGNLRRPRRGPRVISTMYWTTITSNPAPDIREALAASIPRPPTYLLIRIATTLPFHPSRRNQDPSFPPIPFDPDGRQMERSRWHRRLHRLPGVVRGSRFVMRAVRLL